MVRHVRSWLSRSVAVEMVDHGVLRTLWGMTYGEQSMKDISEWYVCGEADG